MHIKASEYTLTAMRAQGAGGQHVNKVSSAVHLRFDILASSLDDAVKQRLLNSNDKRINREGVLVIKAQQFRTQTANKQDAVARLETIIKAASHVPATRYQTRPTRASQRRRVDNKVRRGQVKQMRGKIRAI